MWKLNKPSIDKATGEDIEKLISHCALLDDSDKSSLKSLYTAYNRQRGTVSNTQLKKISDVKANAIYKQYNKTNKGETLEYIRAELNENIDLCPYCSINQVSQLDHFMPRSDYPALAVCRMNLVPLCGVCNQKKSNDDFKQYTHAYYEILPSVPFLIANIYILKLKFVVQYNFDSTAINDISLEKRLNHQAEETELWSRLKKSTNNFINSLFYSCQVTDTPNLVIWLKSQLKNYESNFGLNDWRSAIIRGLLVCKNLDINVVNTYKNLPHTMNAGAGV